MSANKLFLLRQVNMEARYPTRYVFLDVAGQLLDQLSGYLIGLEPDYSPDEVRFVDPDRNVRVRVGPLLTWMHYVSDPGVEVERDAIADALLHVFEPVAKKLEIENLDRVGFRSYSVLAFPTVEEAVGRFREVFFDYYADPLSTLGGKPKQVQLTLRSDGVREVEGHGLNANCSIMPIHILPEIAADLAITTEEWGGGWVLDLDLYGEDLPANLVPTLVDEAITGTRELLERLEKQLTEGTADAIGA